MLCSSVWNLPGESARASLKLGANGGQKLVVPTDLPGESARASLKHDCGECDGHRRVGDLPGESARASLKLFEADGEKDADTRISRANRPGPH